MEAVAIGLGGELGRPSCTRSWIFEGGRAEMKYKSQWRACAICTGLETLNRIRHRQLRTDTPCGGGCRNGALSRQWEVV